MAGVLPHAAQRAGLQLPSKPAEPPLQADVRLAAELQQQTVFAQEPPGGSAAGEPQGGSEMTEPPSDNLNQICSSSSIYPELFHSSLSSFPFFLLFLSKKQENN